MRRHLFHQGAFSNMKRMIIAVLLCLPLLASAQEDYEMGSFWSITGVDTKPGQFDAYVGDLRGLWGKEMDLLIEMGKVKSYKLLANVHRRSDEPDMWLMVEWTSAGAMMDTPYSEWQEITEKMVGSEEKSRDLSIKRGDLRTILSETLAREFSFRE